MVFATSILKEEKMGWFFVKLIITLINFLRDLKIAVNIYSLIIAPELGNLG